MPEAFEVLLADAVVAELNSPARSWAGKFEAVREWYPVYDQEGELATLRVAVVALTIAQEQVVRTKQEFVYVVGINFQIQVQLNNRTQLKLDLDTYTKLAQDVHDFYRDNHYLTAATLDAKTWQIIEARRDDVYSLETLHVEHTWETQVTLAIRGVR